ncbi:MAG: sulfite exporter TauE/SafE family protein [Phycisphaeraceae bacterium]|nr:sulfite exporter TauE/SafE family protein [Phycisphaeraceae bacterium]
MSAIEFTLASFSISVAAGLLGSMLGIGGGIIVVPALTQLLGVDMKYAVAASFIGVIATSNGAAASYVRQHLTNLRLAMVLEVATVAGALGGAYLGGIVSDRFLLVLFGCILGYAAFAMFIDRLRSKVQSPEQEDRLAGRLRLHGQYFDQSLNEHVNYRVIRVWFGLAVSMTAGIISGLLGVGGGILKVPAMHLGMRVPIKVSTATSNFMMGVTAAASAAVYFSRGQIVPLIAAPVGAGVLLGAVTGSRMLPKVKNAYVKMGFVAVLIAVAIRMFYKGLV